MSLATGSVLDLDDSFARELPELAVALDSSPVTHPELVVVNARLAERLGVDAERLRSREGVEILAGHTAPAGSRPVAQAYAGHQFGAYSPRLGDGRALLLGEVVAPDGSRRDIHLKGSGRTPFARGGDGRAALGPMLREYVMGEAMHGLGIPTTRALAVATTGDAIVREVDGRVREVPGAVLARVAASHLRVGSFQYAAATGDLELLRRLTAYAIARHVPDAADSDRPALALYDHVIEVQARLVARWMEVGFVHGVMNTDNVTISGETIDYGPCAFIDAYDPASVYSSIDHGGRYAYGNQPAIATWNLARLGEALLALIADESGVDADAAVELATERLRRFPETFERAWLAAMAAKLGIDVADPDAATLVAGLLDLLHEHGVDYTSALRSLSSAVRGDPEPARRLHPDSVAFDAWRERWLAHVVGDREETAAEMDRRNPVYIPRNHLVEEALAAATDGDLAPFHALVDAVSNPFEDRPGLERFARPAPEEFAAGYRTFCGT